MTDTPLPPWLVVVRRDRSRLYDDLRKSLADDARAEVIVDRRQGETAEPAAGPHERRPLARHQAATWDDLGFLLVDRRDHVAGHRAPPDRVQALRDLGSSQDLARALAAMMATAPAERFLPAWWELASGIREDIEDWLSGQGFRLRAVHLGHGRAGVRVERRGGPGQW